MAESRKVGISLILDDKMSKAIEKTAKALDGMGKAHDKVKTKAEQAVAQVKKFAQAAKPVAILTGALTAAGAAAFLLTKRIAGNADAMIKGAQRLTLSTEAYQKFNHVMNISGTSMEQQRGAMTRFARTARDAANGVKVAEEAFERLNVNVKNQDGTFKSTEDLIYEVSDAFKDMPPTVEKSALMMDMFGRSGAQLAQMMNLGSEGMKELGKDAERLGGIMEESAAKKSEEFIDALTRLDMAVGGVARGMGETMQPMFTRVMEAMANSIVKLKGSYTPIFQGLVDFASQTAQAVVPTLGFLAKAFVGFGTVVMQAWKALQIGLNSIVSGWIQMFNLLIEQSNKWLGTDYTPIMDSFGIVANELGEDMGNIQEASNQTMQAIDMIGDAVLNTGKKLHTTTPKMEAAREATDKLGKATKTLTDAELKAIEKKKKAEEKAAAAKQKELDRIREKILKAADDAELKRLKALEKAEQARRDARKAAHEEAMREAEAHAKVYAKVGLMIGESFTEGFANAEEGQNKFHEGMKSLAHQSVMSAIDIMQAKVIAYATEGAAAAAANVAGIPLIGPLLAAAAGTAMFGLIKGFISYGMGQIPGMAEGGFVTGGMANRDSVPRMLMPGEYVMSKREVANGQPDGIRGGGQTVNVSISSSLPANRAEMKKYVRQNIVPALNELKAQGMY